MKIEKKYTVVTEDLALPEIHTKDHTQSAPDERTNEEIVYETLAMPEIHIKNN